MCVCAAVCLVSGGCGPGAESGDGDLSSEPYHVSSAGIAGPEIVLWPPAWELMYHEGPVRRDVLAREYLSRVRRAGATTVMVRDGSLNDVLPWATGMIRRHGLRVALSALPGHRGGKSHRAIRPRGQVPQNRAVYHQGYVPGRDRQADRYAACPNYRGPLYQAMLRRLGAYVRVAQPEMVVMDTEIWYRPEVVERHCPGAIRRCPRCRTHDGYLRGWSDIGHDLMAAVEKARPGTRTYFFASWNWSALKPSSRRHSVAAWWPGDVGSAPSPNVYYVFRDGRDAVKKTRELAADIPMKGAWPWVITRVNPDDRESRPVNPQRFGAVCGELFRAGAAGLFIYPGPSVAGRNRDDDVRYRQIQAAAEAAKEVPRR